MSLQPLSSINPFLFLGDTVDASDLGLLSTMNITAMVSLLNYDPPIWRTREFNNQINSKDHLYLQCEDSDSQDLLPFFDILCDFISSRTPRKTFLVHCARGISRSATAVIAYLMWRYDMTVRDAEVLVRARRDIHISDNFRLQLHIWEQCRFKLFLDDEEKHPKPPYAAYKRDRYGQSDQDTEEKITQELSDEQDLNTRLDRVNIHSVPQIHISQDSATDESKVTNTQKPADTALACQSVRKSPNSSENQHE